MLSQILTTLHSQLIPVQGGTFFMGATPKDRKAHPDEKPQHAVKVRDFCLCKYPMTQDLWMAVWKVATGEAYNPSHFKGARRPVDSVTWNVAQDFIQKLNLLLNVPAGQSFRLPTEAEWEYAARGGQHSKGYVFVGGDDVDEVAWYEKNSGGETHPVGLKKPNELGLYDMNGNVWEWCQDHWHRNYERAPSDGSAWDDAGEHEARIFRGASWANYQEYCRVSFRASNGPISRANAFGLRLCRDSPVPQNGTYPRSPERERKD